MKKQPKQLVNSEYERREHDAYYTDHWLTEVLLRHVQLTRAHHRVCDPAAGRGDIMTVIKALGVPVVGSDIAPPKKLLPGCQTIRKADFLLPRFKFDAGVNTVITNPPFGDLAQQFVVRTLSDPQIKLAAFLLRCNWNTSAGRGGSRTALFDRGNAGFIPFAYEIVITDRPRWDWWYKTEKQAAKDNKPFHSYSWFVWDRSWKGPSTQFWEGKAR